MKNNSMDCFVCWRMACKASCMMVEGNRYFKAVRMYCFDQFLLLIIHNLLLFLAINLAVNCLKWIVGLFLHLALVIKLNTCSTNYSQMYSNDLSCLSNYDCLDCLFTNTFLIKKRKREGERDKLAIFTLLMSALSHRTLCYWHRIV